MELFDSGNGLDVASSLDFSQSLISTLFKRAGGVFSMKNNEDGNSS
jgi:hypothetical protein